MGHSNLRYIKPSLITTSHFLFQHVGRLRVEEYKVTIKVTKLFEEPNKTV